MNRSGKHSSLLQFGNNYGCKKFYSTGPWLEVNNSGKHSSSLQYGNNYGFKEKTLVQNITAVFGNTIKFITWLTIINFKRCFNKACLNFLSLTLLV